MRIAAAPDIWNLHSHSRYSYQDAMPNVQAMVDHVASMRQPALGITDHGNMAAATQLYRAASKAGIKPFPGSELYVVRDRADKKSKRFHMCVLAYTTEGYRNLVRLSTATHEHFFHKPLIDLGDITEWGEAGLLKGIAATSGCYFGLPIQMLTAGEEGGTRAILGQMARAFDRFYVELQDHGIDHGDGWNDGLVADAMLGIAQDMGLPCVLTQDAHYVMPEDKDDHDNFKRLVAYGDDPDDAVFPGDGFHLASTSWFLRHHAGERLRAGREGLGDLLAAHDLSIPALDHYAYNIPLTVADPDGDLRRDVYTALEAMRLSGQRLGPRYEARIEEELEVITATGMAGYLLLVTECCEWLRDNRILFSTRGSASGSILCWLLGITQLDPIKWGLPFDRFLSRDRTKPPDIDLDVEHDRRKDFITWLRGRFAVHQIGTWTRYKIDADEDDDGSEAGSLLVAYNTVRNRQGLPKLEWKDMPSADQRDLKALHDRKVCKSYGVHPAGLVLTTTEEELRDIVPLMQVASSKTMVTQYDMKEVENLGLVKLDVLGLKTLTVIRHCFEFIGKGYEDWLDRSWIPWSDSKTYTAIGNGLTDGVFQLDGWAARRGCESLKPTTINEVIAAMALFRPATMESGNTESYIKRKHGQERLPQRHDLLMRHTEKTQGIILFQDQVISVLRELGLGPDDLTLFLKAVKSSNDNIAWARGIIEKYQPMIETTAREIGFTDEDWTWFWHAVEGFGNYGFNISHATAYGVMAYTCAYLIAHHTVEYYAALLAVAAGESNKNKKTGRTKEQTYLRAARKRRVRILSPDINLSGATYTVDKRGVRKGLLSIPKIGAVVSTELIKARGDRPFADLDDFARRCYETSGKITGIKPYLQTGDKTIGHLGILLDSGAMDTLIAEWNEPPSHGNPEEDV